MSRAKRRARRTRRREKRAERKENRREFFSDVGDTIYSIPAWTRETVNAIFSEPTAQETSSADDISTIEGITGADAGADAGTPGEVTGGASDDAQSLLSQAHSATTQSRMVAAQAAIDRFEAQQDYQRTIDQATINISITNSATLMLNEKLERFTNELDAWSLKKAQLTADVALATADKEAALGEDGSGGTFATRADQLENANTVDDANRDIEIAELGSRVASLTAQKDEIGLDAKGKLAQAELDKALLNARREAEILRQSSIAAQQQRLANEESIAKSQKIELQKQKAMLLLEEDKVQMMEAQTLYEINAATRQMENLSLDRREAALSLKAVEFQTQETRRAGSQEQSAAEAMTMAAGVVGRSLNVMKRTIAESTRRKAEFLKTTGIETYDIQMGKIEALETDLEEKIAHTGTSGEEEARIRREEIKAEGEILDEKIGQFTTRLDEELGYFAQRMIELNNELSESQLMTEEETGTLALEIQNINTQLGLAVGEGYDGTIESLGGIMELRYDDLEQRITTTGSEKDKKIDLHKEGGLYDLLYAADRSLLTAEKDAYTREVDATIETYGREKDLADINREDERAQLRHMLTQVTGEREIATNAQLTAADNLAIAFAQAELMEKTGELGLKRQHQQDIWNMAGSTVNIAGSIMSLSSS